MPVICHYFLSSLFILLHSSLCPGGWLTVYTARGPPFPLQLRPVCGVGRPAGEWGQGIYFPGSLWGPRLAGLGPLRVVLATQPLGQVPVPPPSCLTSGLLSINIPGSPLPTHTFIIRPFGDLYKMSLGYPSLALGPDNTSLFVKSLRSISMSWNHCSSISEHLAKEWPIGPLSFLLKQFAVTSSHSCYECSVSIRALTWRVQLTGNPDERSGEMMFFPGHFPPLSETSKTWHHLIV